VGIFDGEIISYGPVIDDTGCFDGLVGPFQVIIAMVDQPP